MSELYRTLQTALLGECPDCGRMEPFYAFPTVTGVKRAHCFRCKYCAFEEVYTNDHISTACRIERLV